MLRKKEKDNNYRYRAEFAYKTFSQYFNGTVGDIGSGGSPAYFRTLKKIKYIAIDFNETREIPDIVCNLEIEPLPFNDNYFDLTLCFDCIEHCADPYFVFDELCRTTNRYVIISLPNNWPGYFWHMLKGRYTTQGYGLPETPQPPGFRHKWFFNMEDAEKFLIHRAHLNNFKVKEIVYAYEPVNNNLIRFAYYPKINLISDERLSRLLSNPEYCSTTLGKYSVIVNFMNAHLNTRFVFYFLKTSIFFMKLPFLIIDTPIKYLIWGWGSRFRYLNLFCRQIWVVLEK